MCRVYLNALRFWGGSCHFLLRQPVFTYCVRTYTDLLLLLPDRSPRSRRSSRRSWHSRRCTGSRNSRPDLGGGGGVRISHVFSHDFTNKGFIELISSDFFGDFFATLSDRSLTVSASALAGSSLHLLPQTDRSVVVAAVAEVLALVVALAVEAVVEVCKKSQKRRRSSIFTTNLDFFLDKS